MTKSNYLPDKGDIVWIDFDPAKGHEQKGRRPAVVVSSKLFNQKTGMAYMCPITNTRKNYVFRVECVDTITTGFIMCDQLKSFDWSDRKAEFIEQVDTSVMEHISNIISVITE